MRKAYLFRRPPRYAGYWRLTLTSFALGIAAVLLMPDNATPTAGHATHQALVHATWSDAPDKALTAPPAHSTADRDCAALDPHDLDGDDDGAACERLPQVAPVTPPRARP